MKKPKQLSFSFHKPKERLPQLKGTLQFCKRTLFFLVLAYALAICGMLIIS